MLFKQASRASQRRRIHQVLTHPICPFEPARIKVQIGQKNAARKLRLACHWRGKERRVEHLKGDGSRGDADTLQLPNLAAGAASRNDSERLAQVFSDGLGSHQFLVSRAPAGGRVARTMPAWTQVEGT